MNLLRDGWFSEVNKQWPGQAMSLEVEEVLYEGKSKFQDILVFKRFVVRVNQSIIKDIFKILKNIIYISLW